MKNTFRDWLDTRLIQKYKSISLLYTNDKWPEKEIRGTILFIIASNNINYPGVTLPKHVKDLYDKNFKSLMRISEDERISHVHGLVGLT